MAISGSGQIVEEPLGKAKRYAALASLIRCSRDLQVLLQDFASARPMNRVPQTTHFLAVLGTFFLMSLLCFFIQNVEQYLLKSRLGSLHSVLAHLANLIFPP